MKQIFRKRGILFVLSSPSGTGKTSLARNILQNDSNLKQSISVTTRSKRKGEVDAVDYFFITEDKYRQMIADDMLLEHAQAFGNYYGTPRQYVESMLANCVDILCVIEWQGGMELMKKLRNDVVSIFILPPSLTEQKSRLLKRDTDDVTVINRRLAHAKKEIVQCNHYDYVVINDDFDECVVQLVAILTAERSKRVRQDIACLIDAIEK